MKLEQVILRDTRANQPLATAVPIGTLFYVTNESVLERSNGTAWQSYSSAAVVGGITELTGDVVAGPGSGSQASIIVPDAITTAKILDANVTNAKLAVMAANTLKGNNTGAPAAPIDLTTAQATAILDVLVGDSGAGGTKGLVPAPAIGDATKFLRGDATWADASGSSSGLVKVTIPISQADLEGMPTTPKILVAAPGAGKVIIPIRISGDFDNTVAYTNTPSMTILYEPNLIQICTAFSWSFNSIVKTFRIQAINTTVATGINRPVNKALIATLNTALTGTGASSGRISFVYFIEDIAI